LKDCVAADTNGRKASNIAVLNRQSYARDSVL
jgi:hypothetical protein